MADERSYGAEGKSALSRLSGTSERAQRKPTRRNRDSKIPNDDSLEALRQLRAGEVTRYNSVKEMIDDIL